TTHSAARAGKPQLVLPLIIDQFYWAYRVQELGVGPGGINIGRVSKKELEWKVLDLVGSRVYREKAEALGALIRSENGVLAACERIEASVSPGQRLDAAVNE
ncbi:MAG: glycosyltransferase, partial [Treponema sp.]|nr:glycosyltransferase [Treponema sp.]